MTENGMILRQDDALMPTSFAGVMQMGDALFKSGLLPQEIKSGSAAMAIILTGRELGIGPMLSLRSIFVVKGKPTLSAQLMGALIFSKGHSYAIKRSDNEQCMIEFKRASGAAYTHTFTLEDAKRAGLTGQTWSAYPKAMLFSRCMSAGARAFMPDVIANMYTPEEMASVTAAEVVDAVPMVDTETGEIAKSEPTGGNGHVADWTKSADERAAFAAWREKNALTDADCKRLASAYKKVEPVKLFSELGFTTREELANAIEAQMAREMALKGTA